jgi:hypothetical protein
MDKAQVQSLNITFLVFFSVLSLSKPAGVPLFRPASWKKFVPTPQKNAMRLQWSVCQKEEYMDAAIMLFTKARLEASPA